MLCISFENNLIINYIKTTQMSNVFLYEDIVNFCQNFKMQLVSRCCFFNDACALKFRNNSVLPEVVSHFLFLVHIQASAYMLLSLDELR